MHTHSTIYLLIFIIVFVSHFKNIFHFSNYAMWSHKMSCLLHFHSHTVVVCVLFCDIMSFPSSNARTTAFLFIILSVSLGSATFECCCCRCLYSLFRNTRIKGGEFESQKVSVSICKCARNETEAKDKKNLLHAISNEKWKQSSGPDVKRHLKMSRVYFNERFVFISTVHVFARTFDPHRRRKQKLIIAFSSIILK